MPRNVGDSFTSGKGYGGVAYLGNTRTGYNDEVTGLEEWFARFVTGNLPSPYQNLTTGGRIGVSEAYSKIAVDTLYSAMCHNMLGDPKVRMWTSTPQHFNDGIVVERYDDGIYVSHVGRSSSVFCCSNDGTVTKNQTPYSGYCQFTDVDPNGTIVVTHQNYIPYIAPTIVQNSTIENSQYVIATSYKAGNHVDSNRTAGDVTIPSGVEYEIESVTLSPGFKVEKGALFSAFPRDY